MQKYTNLLIISLLVGLGRISQIIFSVLYAPHRPTHLGIGSGTWTDHITMTGFELQHYMQFTKSTPMTFDTGGLDRYNTSCRYGLGQCISFWGQRLASAFDRIDTIQYIGKDVDISQPSDITNKFHTINTHSPRRWYPYLFAQYIGPSTKKDQTNIDAIKLTRSNTIAIGEEGIRYSCDMKKIAKISQLTYPVFLKAIADHNPEYWYPCNTDDLAHALAFNYYHYMDDIKNASLYYMVASFHDETPKITLSMPAIIQGREGNNKISAFLRYDRLQNNYKELQKKDLPDDKHKQIEDNVTIALQKMVSEFSLSIIQQASLLSQEKKTGASCVHNISCLKHNGYISIIIDQLQHTCKTDPISCEILSIGIKSGRIIANGTLIYPLDKGMEYAWREDKNLWWLVRK